MNEFEIQNLLHHRPPYLMVSKVHALNEFSIEVEKNHRGDEAHIKGHFPGAPVVPGAMLQEVCTQAAGILITKFYSPMENYHSEKTKGHALGVLKKVDKAKYMKITKPNKPILAKVKLTDNLGDLFKFSAQVIQDDQIVAKLAFQLVNIKEEVLHGEK